MYYIVALGNPGEKYADTRHNFGWQVIDHTLPLWGLPALIENKKVSGNVTEGEVEGILVRILCPDTFMNNSGSAARKLVPRGEEGQLIVVHDDIDLPLGEIKVGKGRGAGSHNGVASIIEKLGTKDFIRVRVGIAPRSFWTGTVKRPRGGGPLERFVLKSFSGTEQKQLPEVYEKARVAIEFILHEGVERAMNEVNQLEKK